MKIDKELLGGMYELPRLRASFLQDQRSCEKYMELFVWAIGSLCEGDAAKSNGWCSMEDLELIKSCKLLLEQQDERIKWLEFCPQYGCLILAFTAASQPPGVVNVEILGLDQTTFAMHGNFSQGKLKYDQFLKASGRFASLPVGRIDENYVPVLTKKFHHILGNAGVTSDGRGKRKREKHPYTPDFVHVVLEYALDTVMDSEDADETAELPYMDSKGGFADFEWHSKGHPSNTSFPLVCCLLQWVLTPNKPLALYQNTMIYIDLRLTQIILDQVKKSGVSSDNNATKRKQLDWAKSIVEVAAHKISVQILSKIEVTALLDSAKHLDNLIKTTAYELQDAEARAFELTNVDQDLNRPDAFQNFKLQLPERVHPVVSHDVAAIQRLAKQNSGLVPAFHNCADFNVLELDRFLTSRHFRAKDRLEDALQIRATVEEVFWRRAERGLDEDVVHEDKVPMLACVVDKYQEVICHVRKHLKGDCFMKTEIFSRELLVVWVAYCLTFKALRSAHSDLFEHVGVALHFQDLEHLVLSEKRLYDVLLRVKTFLQQNYVPNMELFSLRTPEASFRFGARFTERHLAHIFEQERENAEQRVNNHWREVQAKKERARQLSQELDALRIDLDDAKHARGIAQRDYNSEKGCSGVSDATRETLRAKQHLVSSLESRKTEKTRDLTTTKEAPPPVIQPLPADCETMKEWLFFLHSPKTFKALATLTFTAQQLLVPCFEYEDIDGVDRSAMENSLLSDLPPCSVATHYNTHQSCHLKLGTHHNAREDLLRLFAETNEIPRDIGPRNIDDIQTPGRAAWHPDRWHVRMAWLGSRHGYGSLSQKEVDPYGIDRASTVLYFTEQIDRSIQWAMPQDGEPSLQRGNQGVASQNKRPCDLSRIDYMMLCSVRAFPNKQIRSVINTFLNHSFPLENESIQKLLLQALFHVGTLESKGKLGSPMRWKCDLFDNSFLAAVKKVLVQRESELHFSPTESKAALLLGEVSAFFSCWDESLKIVSRKVAEAAAQWAKDVDNQIAAASESVVDKLKGKQSVFLYQAIICLAKGVVDNDDLRTMIILTTKCHSLRMGLKVSESSQEAIEVDRYQSRCLEALTSKLCLLVDIATNNSGILTEALHEVVHAPTNLSWHPFLLDGEAASTCFEAYGNDNCVYTLNILTGAVLVNGLPPSTLPSSILLHPLYVKTFGRSLFRVVLREGVYETSNHVDGRWYQFFLKNGDLHVAELDEAMENRLELLDPQKSNTWGGELPVRLRELHSHWFCRETNVVVLRGTMFHQRETYFVLFHRGNANTEPGTVTCRCIPNFFRQKDLAVILENIESFDELLKHESGATQTLKKIENREFIHIMRRQNKILFNLPRFNLTFFYDSAGEICCDDFPDFRLSRQQLLPVLWGFRGYLVLENPKATHCREVCILFSEGEVQREQDAVVVSLSTDSGADCGWHRTWVHERLGLLNANEAVSRLRLAALHVATSHNVPDRMIEMRGVERAMELIRQCWTTAPLSTGERDAIRNATILSEGAFPNVILLCRDILQTSEQTAFLYPSNPSGAPLRSELTDRNDTTTAYQCLRKQFFQNRRVVLTQDEEIRVMGRAVEGSAFMPHFNQRVSDCSFPVSDELVEHIEAALKNIVTEDQQSLNMDEFPFDLPESSGALDSIMFAELKSSWVLHKDQSSIQATLSDDWSAKLDEICEKVQSCREGLEADLLQALNSSGSAFDGIDAKLISSLRLSNELPTAFKADLVRMAYNPKLIESFNPLLSETGQAKLMQNIVYWLRLCVAEDKQDRLRHCRKNSDLQALTMEARVFRTFNAHDFPAWVAFEVESRLQIRQEQCLVATHLLSNPGTLIQLNMGSGKTRVILPMLVLEYSLHRHEYHQITRLTVLSALFNENCQFFKGQLTGSLAFVKVCTIPFRREIDLDERRVEALVRLAKQCSRDRAIVMVAPEHRLSLELKLMEMSSVRNFRDNSVSLGMRYLCGGIWRDILDECDELLHHRFQLVYACGSVEELPSRSHRIHAVQAVLKLLFCDENVKEFLASNTDVFLGSKDLTMLESEKFPEIRVSSGTSAEWVILAFRTVLANALLRNPPYELQWLGNHALKAHLTSAIIDPCASMDSLDLLPSPNKEDILALRGLLAGDILWHCLQKRHKVDFGIARSGAKRICVPFRGADTPSLRSEFSHPEVAIVLTTLAYYREGLDEDQIKEAFVALLNLGPAARQSYYNGWFSLSLERIRRDSPELEEAIDTVKKLDPCNPFQFKMLVEHFSSNWLTINFWLNTCVFPGEMQHHPQRLTASSWNLAHNPKHPVIGFSGTNDNHRILPLQVTQFFKEDFTDADSNFARIWQEMMGTNGRMVGVIVNNTIDCIELKSGKRFQPVLDVLAQGRNVHAIIDAGAIFVGVPNKDIAAMILEYMDKRDGGAYVQGVVFYENRPNKVEGWMIMERSGRILPQNRSPVAECDTFAFFDEQRCRGSDLKLAKHAVALLTLGPKMRKDSFMQAAGRMRKLGFHQKLILVAMRDVVNEVRSIGSATFDVKNILFWTLKNTVKMNEEGLMPWTSQGLFFASTLGKPEKAMLDEDCSLDSFYGAPFATEAFSKAALRKKKSVVDHVGGLDKLSLRQQTMMDNIMERCNKLGTHSVCTIRGVDEECERELELVLETEEEKEVEIPLMEPVAEVKWDFDSVFTASSPGALPPLAGVCPLGKFVEENLNPKTLSRIKWSGKVFGTNNFFQSVQHSGGAKTAPLNFYLRPIDVVLRFETGEILLVSERESDRLLELFWERRETLAMEDGTLVEFFHFSIVRTASDGVIADLALGAMALSSTGDAEVVEPIPDEILAEIQLFAGETTYSTDARKTALSAMLLSKDNDNVTACGEPDHLVEMRGLSETLAFSDLEKACFAIAKEAGEALVTGSMRQHKPSFA